MPISHGNPDHQIWWFPGAAAAALRTRTYLFEEGTFSSLRLHAKKEGVPECVRCHSAEQIREVGFIQKLDPGLASLY